jgi:hypothetical protein
MLQPMPKVGGGSIGSISPQSCQNTVPPSAIKQKRIQKNKYRTIGKKDPKSKASKLPT